jgi:hypothetical protein
MFEALVLICLMGDVQKTCIEAADTYGPYKTEEACKVRLAKMVYDLSMVQSPFKPVATKCKEGEKA